MPSYRVILLDLQDAPDHLAHAVAEDLPRLYATCPAEDRAVFFSVVFSVPEDLPLSLVDLIGRGLLYSHDWSADGTVTTIVPIKDASVLTPDPTAQHGSRDPVILYGHDGLRPSVRSVLLHGHHAVAGDVADLDANEPMLADAIKHLALRVAQLEALVRGDHFRCHMTNAWYPMPQGAWSEGTVVLRARHQTPFYIQLDPLARLVAEEDWEEYLLASACDRWGPDWIPSSHDGEQADHAARHCAVVHAILRATSAWQQQCWMERCTALGYPLPRALLV